MGLLNSCLATIFPNHWLPNVSIKEVSVHRINSVHNKMHVSSQLWCPDLSLMKMPDYLAITSYHFIALVATNFGHNFPRFYFYQKPSPPAFVLYLIVSLKWSNFGLCLFLTIWQSIHLKFCFPTLGNLTKNSINSSNPRPLLYSPSHVRFKMV